MQIDNNNWVKLKLLFSLSIFFCSSTNIIAQNDWKKNKLQGKVKYLKENNYTASLRFGEIIKVGRHLNSYAFRDRELTFNKNGNEIKKNWYSANGSMKFTSYKKYNRDNKLIENTTFDSDGTLGSKKTIDLSTKGRIIEDNTYSASEKPSKTITILDNEENEIESTNYSYNGELSDKHKYKYNFQNNSREIISYNPDGSLLEMKKEKFDLNHNLISYEVYNSEGIMTSNGFYKYDENSNLLEWTWSIGWKYNDPGEPVITKIIYSYDEWRNENKTQSFTFDGRLVSTTTQDYEFDKKGNWIKRIYKFNNEPSVITERIIDYY